MAGGRKKKQKKPQKRKRTINIATANEGLHDFSLYLKNTSCSVSMVFVQISLKEEQIYIKKIT